MDESAVDNHLTDAEMSEALNDVQPEVSGPNDLPCPRVNNTTNLAVLSELMIKQTVYKVLRHVENLFIQLFLFIRPMFGVPHNLY